MTQAEWWKPDAVQGRGSDSFSSFVLDRPAGSLLIKREGKHKRMWWYLPFISVSNFSVDSGRGEEEDAGRITCYSCTVIYSLFKIVRSEEFGRKFSSLTTLAWGILAWIP